MIKNPIHLQVLDFIKNSNSSENEWVQHYLGSNKATFGIKSIEIKKFSKKIIDDHNLDQKKLVDLLNSLYQNATTFNEMAIAACILGTKAQFCRNLDPKILDNWLNYTHGWAEVDSLCQSNFTPDILLLDWAKWEKLLTKFNHDKNIHKRRASLVLLNKSVAKSDDPRFSKLAFQNIESLKSEKEILITKALSWLLRSLVAFHQDELMEYLAKNKDTLPKIAYREALTKATTGKKYNKKINTDFPQKLKQNPWR
jgi:3-methyladenine DNA glycosylase AlkD